MNTESTYHGPISIFGIIIIATILAVAFVIHLRTSGPTITPEQYQLVTFENGDRYVGHLKELNSSHPYLADSYRLEEDIPGEFELEAANTIYMNWDKVQFWTNLKPDSELVNLLQK
ncbi:hypothetical protein COV82_02010 [Candidatus Peregrinibacteria bacterium CG11_big_fil_rev_8_21_14_0_20_46_8]|nr:MAG: hypothetical protein COV82_02010 [Candidatus Peregrinibacteria bacterium CG11_big_fil_rev_8_21_14_0_20_46_8]